MAEVQEQEQRQLLPSPPLSPQDGGQGEGGEDAPETGSSEGGAEPPPPTAGSPGTEEPAGDAKKKSNANGSYRTLGAGRELTVLMAPRLG